MQYLQFIFFIHNSAIKKEERGYSIEFAGTAYGIDISTVLWKDNKSAIYLQKQIKVYKHQMHGSIENKRNRTIRMISISAVEVKLLQLPRFRAQIAAALVTYSDKRTVGGPSAI